MSKLSRFVDRNKLKLRKSVWRWRHGAAGYARACFVFGVQRSGTTLVLRCFDRSPETEVLGEDSAATENFRLKPDEDIRHLIEESRYRLIIFKPLIESHRARELLKLTKNSTALWVFRRVEDRANSAVAKFGNTNQELLHAFSRGESMDAWQAKGLTEHTLNIIRQFDYKTMTPQSAAAIFWYVRNALYFSLGLDELPNVLPVAYEDLVSRPAAIMKSICRFSGCTYRPDMIADVHNRSVGREAPKIDNAIAELCSPMYERLYDLQRQKLESLRNESD